MKPRPKFKECPHCKRLIPTEAVDEQQPRLYRIGNHGREGGTRTKEKCKGSGTEFVIA